MYEVQHYRSDHLPDAIYQQMSSFIRLVWLSHLKGEDRFWVLVDPTGHIDHFYVAERGVLISHACVNTRTVTQASESYVLRGLGAVFTYPAFRGEGYARQVVQAATDFILQGDADVGMLFCAERLASFYASCGWTKLSTPQIAFGDPAAPHFNPDECVMMLYLSEKGKAARAVFDQQPVYVGEYTW